MEYPADAEVDEYETTLIYSKDGTEKEFTLENYPSDDSTWIFVDSKSRLIKEGYIPPIHDFSLITENGEDLTNFVLSDPGFSLLMISNDITEADQEEILKGIELAYTCLENNISFYLLTASPEEEVKKFNDQLTAFYVDETSLKTIVRANPGYMLIKDGVVMRKWAHRDLPDEERLISAVLESPERKIPDNGITVMIMIAVITAISIIINYILKTRNGKS